jgi:hypothetical protein
VTAAGMTRAQRPGWHDACPMTAACMTLAGMTSAMRSSCDVRLVHAGQDTLYMA